MARYQKDIILKGGDLFSKGGFGDGDMLEGHVEMDDTLEAFSDRLFSRDDHIAYGRLATIALAEVYLLPLFDRPLTLRLPNYCHNGCRVQEAGWWDDRDWEFPNTLPSVEVLSEEVYSMLYSMKLAIEWAIAGKAVTFPERLIQTARIFSEELKVPVAIGSDALKFPSTTVIRK